MINWEIEDYLSENKVFLNGINGNIASLGAYMTVIDNRNLIKAYDNAPYTKEQWKDFLSYLEGHFYLAPTFKLLYLYIKKLIEL